MVPWSYRVLPAVSRSYPRALGTLPMHSSPFRHSTRFPKKTFACDLHVLATPPAFVLSQDQTLHLIYRFLPPVRASPDRRKKFDKKIAPNVCRMNRLAGRLRLKILTGCHEDLEFDRTQRQGRSVFGSFQPGRIVTIRPGRPHPRDGITVHFSISVSMGESVRIDLNIDRR